MKLDTTGRRKSGKLDIALEVLLAIMLGSACFYVFISMFGLTWSPSSMFSGGIQNGIAGIWDHIADKVGSLDYVILPKYKASSDPTKAAKCGTALTLILAAFSVISYFIIKAGTRILLLLIAVPLTIVMFTLGLTPSAYAGAFFAAAIIIVLAVFSIDGKIDLKFLIVPVAVLLVASAAVVALEKTVTLTEPKSMAKFSESVKASFDKARYGSDPLPSGEVGRLTGKSLKASRGDIDTVKEALMYGTSDEGSKGAGSKTALVVKMSQPESYYLRGFIGATYDKNKWSTLSNDTFYSMRDAIYWMNRRNFDGLSEMSRASELGNSTSTGYDSGTMFGADTSGDTGNGTTNTENNEETDDEDEDDSDEEDEDEDEEEDDSDDGDDEEEEEWDLTDDVYAASSVYADSEEDGNSISIKVKGASRRNAFIPYELILKPAKGNKPRASEMVLPKGTRNYGGSYLGTDGLTGKSSYSYKSAKNITGSWTDAVGRLYTAPQSEEVQEYFISESHYNVIQYKRYLDVPDKLKELFNMEIGSPGDIQDEHADYKETIELISNYLSERFIYTESFGRPERGEDFVEEFVNNKQGCDVHFATLAALLFRYYGIPARYVEGYLVTPSMIQGKETNADISVAKLANHAWTEIYIDGFGWIPFEATSDYRGIMQEANMAVGLQNVDYNYTPPQPDDTEEEETQSEDDKEARRIRAKLRQLLIVVFWLLIIAAVLYVAYKVGRVIYTEMKWKKAFNDEDPKKGIKAMYQYTKVKGWKLSPVGEKLGLRASYSKAKMHEPEREKMRTEFEMAKEQAKKDKADKKAAAKKNHAKESAASKQEKEAAKKEKAEKKAAEKQQKEAAKKEKAEKKAAAKKEKAEKKAAETADRAVKQDDTVILDNTVNDAEVKQAPAEVENNDESK